MKPSEVLSDLDLKILQELYVNKLPVADVVKCFQVDHGYLGRLLRRPQVIEFVQDLDLGRSAEYAALEQEAIRVLREGMSDERASVRQAAADKVLRVLGRYKESPTVAIQASEVKFTSVVSTDGAIATRPERASDANDT